MLPKDYSLSHTLEHVSECLKRRQVIPKELQSEPAMINRRMNYTLDHLVAPGRSQRVVTTLDELVWGQT